MMLANGRAGVARRMASALNFHSHSPNGTNSLALRSSVVELNQGGKCVQILPLKSVLFTKGCLGHGNLAAYKLLEFRRCFGSEDESISSAPNNEVAGPIMCVGEEGNSAPPAQSPDNSLEARALVKVSALTHARKLADSSKGAYDAGKNGSCQREELERLKEEWISHEQALSVAYSQAIKYLARTRRVDSSAQVEQMMDQWVDRMGFASTANNDDEWESTVSCEKFSNKMKGLLDVMASGNSVSADKETSIPILSAPTRRDFHNILHSRASSKVRQKGLRAEALLLQMTELASCSPKVFETMPDSKAFGFAIKCHGGTTLKQAHDRVVNLVSIHEFFAASPLSNISSNDPAVLMPAIKSLKNIWKPEEEASAKKWLHDLHSFVLNSRKSRGESESSSSIGELHEDRDDGVVNDTQGKAVDLTATYMGPLRGYAWIKNNFESSGKAYDVLQMMIEVKQLLDQQEKQRNPGYFSIDVTTHAYNLVLNAFKDAKGKKGTKLALKILDAMVQSRKEASSENAASPSSQSLAFPDKDSFSTVIQALKYLDSQTALEKAQNLLDEFEDMCSSSNELAVDHSSKVYNDFLELNIKYSPKGVGLLEILDKIIETMEEKGKENALVRPTVSTWSLVLKACSYARRNKKERELAFQRATSTFEKLKAMESSNDDPAQLTDKCYFHMMKCVGHLIDNRDDREAQITSLFKEACKKGLVSADVLKAFKTNVTEELFAKVAGEGRLADSWIENVTSGKALYTDGTTGGEGKHARRQGKSTSDWKRKQRLREQDRLARKEEKRRRKLRRKGLL